MSSENILIDITLFCVIYTYKMNKTHILFIHIDLNNMFLYLYHYIHCLVYKKIVISEHIV